MKRLYLSDTVAGEISAYIAAKELAPGTQLPSMGEWMERLEVGRSTLREGLKKLEAEGIIDIVNGKGLFVSEQRTFQLLASLGIKDAKAHLIEMLEVREALEVQAIVLAIRHAADHQLDAMASHLDDYRRAREKEDFLGVSEADAAFHLAIYHACGNRVLVGLIQMMHDELYLSWDSPEDRLRVFDAGFPFHEALLEAMQQRDEPAARAAFTHLIAATRQSVDALSA
ncbi:FCD domain-containing protein [Halomonas sp. DP8Y7-3]|uniref:FadR/GntR family transcriptional regulator n=1 Tax=Halomonas sp. DP8Y7-3 TaxID=2859079 RepID=UPI001C988723|nr:FCD domain-containing protein [Halomonas sp. DP8Y7-3]MBY5930178.1 FCD domain-containing protein [Halomonas sp. DP8Y7-3]